ncbi:hypothetical protein [Haloferula rosea]|uniref:Uncharacterized protein n=1 Tax=Haloferula rosea TaxID=490093 RepID=A0A934RFY8_9BACT|nr:hypothetical protein [Haloferula rosea]MBK1828461.1 hypothetical protein [Haloferula rosea]
MKPVHVLLVCVAVASCSEKQEPVTDESAPEVRQLSSRGSATDELNGTSLHSIGRLPAESRAEAFRMLLLEAADADLDLAMEAVETLESADEKLDLLYVFADDLVGRGEMVRLPSLFWVAAHPAVDEGLKTTVLADLRRELGLSWQPDLATMALKLEEHLIAEGAMQ